ncbi:hypothetical protein SDC9_132657 [bioreactor metagenome]|uniref:Uncharacterized protein n=1 Tax=bioreactor metagenome TaxID=1076179 RepID=A0A645D870_9ZZZZ
MLMFRILDDIILMVIMFSAGFIFAEYVDKSYSFIAHISFATALVGKLLIFILQDRSSFKKEHK